jgi:hypothetical protein
VEIRLKRPSTGLQEPGNGLSAPAVASTAGPAVDLIRAGPQRQLNRSSARSTDRWSD